MSTDLKTPAPAPSEPRQPDKPKLDLSVAQVVGGALAAMTAAFLGSRLSVAGTVVGAALASIVAAVAGNVYTASLRTTHEKVRTVFQGKVAGSDMPAEVAEVGRGSATTVHPSSTPGRRRLSVRSMLLGALAAFALAAVALTGIELATGQALSGGSGTTVSQVTEQRASSPTQKPAPAATADPASPSASDSPTSTPSETPSSPAPVPAPSTPADSPSSSPSDTPTPTPTPSATQTQTATATPEAPGADG